MKPGDLVEPDWSFRTSAAGDKQPRQLGLVLSHPEVKDHGTTSHEDILHLPSPSMVRTAIIPASEVERAGRITTAVNPVILCLTKSPSFIEHLQ